jgi:hypothetical protein
MFVTIINDCRDTNAFNRQATRAAALLKSPVVTVGVRNDLEAAGNLIDSLDAAGGTRGVIIVNVAPRNGVGKKWPNGTPFGWFKVGETFVLSSIDGQTLSLAKKIGVLETVHVFDIPTVMDWVVEHGTLDRATADRVVATQFRSYEFLPRAAAWLVEGLALPTEPMTASEFPDAPAAVWIADNFGNCKTTLLVGESAEGTPFAKLPRYERLKDVPDGEFALITGSSGLGDKRFLEAVIQGGDASAALGVESRDSLSEAATVTQQPQH